MRVLLMVILLLVVSGCEFEDLASYEIEKAYKICEDKDSTLYAIRVVEGKITKKVICSDGNVTPILPEVDE